MEGPDRLPGILDGSDEVRPRGTLTGMAVRVPPTAITLRFHRRYATTSDSTVA